MMNAELEREAPPGAGRPHLELGCGLMTLQKTKREEGPTGPVTVEALLAAIRGGDERARAGLFEHLHSELHRVARGHMAGQAPDHSLHATALLHEAFLRLSNSKAGWQNRGHFLGVASRTMRHVLVDHARAKQASKRQGNREHSPLDQLVDTYESRSGNLPALDDALERLKDENPEMARAVDLHFFGGIPLREIPALLEIAPRTFERHWALAKRWLHKELS